MIYKGSCHCAKIQFEFTSPLIENGTRCNCTICVRKGALMTEFTLAPKDINISIKDNALSTYTFASHVAKHHFCNNCGVYTFHQSMKEIGYYRINLGCVETIDTSTLPFSIYDGASI
ncbi:GFA family protein [Marinicellulosiphila megalodicopiae]|uniref:GFA family protein n=1 Tax=Marinicellulosiphila megalodicopiae TaxID=2724896 RepID=UPI003BB053B5